MLVLVVHTVSEVTARVPFPMMVRPPPPPPPPPPDPPPSPPEPQRRGSPRRPEAWAVALPPSRARAWRCLPEESALVFVCLLRGFLLREALAGKVWEGEGGGCGGGLYWEARGGTPAPCVPSPPQW